MESTALRSNNAEVNIIYLVILSCWMGHLWFGRWISTFRRKLLLQSH